MKVIRAGVLGFCKGVRRAVEMAWRLSSKEGVVIFTLGPLIHNSKVLESLSARGVTTIKESEISSIPENSAVIIRAHGVAPAVERELERRGVSVFDATCPHVKVSQRKAEDFAKRGFKVFLAGEENHAEIEGIRGYAEDGFESAVSAGGACFVVSNPGEAASAAGTLFGREPFAKTALIGQTTISLSEYRAIGDSIRQFFPSLETLDSICGATADRQEALRELAALADALIIAGSGESANTQRLLSLARELGKPAWLLEDKTELPPEISLYKTIGISAGASAPDSLVEEIEEALAAL